jgi:hypothetical protein
MVGLVAILTFLLCQEIGKVRLQKCEKVVSYLDAAIPKNIIFL